MLDYQETFALNCSHNPEPFSRTADEFVRDAYLSSTVAIIESIRFGFADFQTRFAQERSRLPEDQAAANATGSAIGERKAIPRMCTS